MRYSIENKFLKVEVDAAGAQLKSVYSKQSGVEYLWQGDPAYWTGSAPNIFPTVGRMYKNIYTYEGNTYSLRTHGVARYYAYKMFARTATKLVFLLEANEDTLKEYPFRFAFYAIFELFGSELKVSYKVKNEDEKEMIFSVGGHPGINVPFAGGNFEDYYIEFAEKTNVTHRLLSENMFMSGKVATYPLEDGVRLPLEHQLFDNDAIVLSNTCREVAIKTTVSDSCVKMKYYDFKFFGLWHAPKTDAPYVCLEPWSALPATEGVIDDLSTKEDMAKIKAGEEKTFSYTLEICE